MKAIILQQLLDLIESHDDNEKALLKSKLVNDISLASLDLKEKNEAHIKKLITDTIERYADTSNPALKSALQDHYKTLEKLIVNYC